jgi:hypothetical protein
MIAVMVRFQYENEFNEARLQQIAEGARTKYSSDLAWRRRKGIVVSVTGLLIHS